MGIFYIRKKPRHPSRTTGLEVKYNIIKSYKNMEARLPLFINTIRTPFLTRHGI